MGCAGILQVLKLLKNLFFTEENIYYKCVVTETAMLLEILWYDLCKALG